MCACVSFLPPIYIRFFPFRGKSLKTLSLSFLHRHRALAAFTARVKPTMGAVAAFAAHASSRRIFLPVRFFREEKVTTAFGNLGTRVRDSAGKNDRANEEEEEDESTSNALASLERELSLQISLENYAEAAKLRDSIALLKRDDLVAVETCNSLFYDAFRERGFHPHALQSVGKRSARAMHAPGNADSFRRRERERVVADSV